MSYWNLFTVTLLMFEILHLKVSAFMQPTRSFVHLSYSARHVLNIHSLSGSTTIEKPVTTEKDTVSEQKKKMDEKSESYSGKRGGWAVRLFNDPFNKREFVAMCLSKIVGLTDGQSYQVMMQAHQNGVAVVGRFDLERAELYKTSLVDHGLLSDMIPVEDD